MRITPEVITVLERAEATPDGIKLTGQLERREYVAVAKVLEGAGFKWNRKLGVHVHGSASAADALESMLSSGIVITAGDTGFFETTGYALARLMQIADVRSPHWVLEPSAGSGNIIRACLDAGAFKVDAIEYQSRFTGALKELVRPRGAVTAADFLTIEPSPVYDRVVMNPPFSRQQDITHVLRALDWLRPGGRLVSIMSSGARFRSDRRTAAFHERIAGLSPEWEDLPEGSFKASGTMVDTCIVSVTAKAANQNTDDASTEGL